MITLDQVKKLLPSNKHPEVWVDPLNQMLPKYEINTKNRIASFIAQCAHESVDFTAFKENLNYSADGLMKTWPKRFPTVEVALPYARNPAKIANKVYADRMGNGDEASGDGNKFRGRGLIQLTGKANYVKFATAIMMTMDETIAYLETPAGALESACWFWKTLNLNKFADTADIAGMTKTINGGNLGLQGRKAKFDNALKVLT